MSHELTPRTVTASATFPRRLLDRDRFECPRSPWHRGPVDSWVDGRRRWGTRLARALERMTNSDGPLGFILDRLRGYRRYGGTRWEWPWRPRTCSFCGGVHPDDADRLLREGWTVEATDKGYKVYLHPPGAWRPVPPVKGYAGHFPREWPRA